MMPKGPIKQSSTTESGPDFLNKFDSPRRNMLHESGESGMTTTTFNIDKDEEDDDGARQTIMFAKNTKFNQDEEINKKFAGLSCFSYHLRPPRHP